MSMADGLQAVLVENRDALLRFLEARGAGAGAEDLLQEVWVRCTSQRHGPISNYRSYVFRIAHNLMIDRYRAQRQRTEREAAWVETIGAANVDISDAPSPDRALDAQRLLSRASAVLNALGEPTITIFRRFRLDGDPQKNIARDLGVSLATVEKHLQKAYRALVTLKRQADTE